MTDSPFKLNTKSINWLAAVIIGLFIIFPDVVRNLENDDIIPERMEQFRIPPPGQNPDHISPNDHSFEMPPRDMDFSLQMPGSKHSLAKILIEFIYFFFLALILLYVNNGGALYLNYFPFFTRHRLTIFIVLTLIICILAQFLYAGLKGFNSMPGGGPDLGIFNGMVMFKCFFVGIITVIFSQLIQVLFKQQEIRLEMERLRSENLRNRFDALTSQINPHFFFNSLNALSGLVRIKDNTNALKYINELSLIFRYVLKGNWKELVPLQDEMNFLCAYRYLLQIRYGDRLDFDIDVNSDDYSKYRLPYLSLQPLIENVIKHNTISSTHPMTIKINIKNEDTLVVSNPIQSKIETEPGTGIGLSNLSNRYKLLSSKDISTNISNEIFVVELPLTHVNQEHHEGTDN
ncbi:sensor histidine kinase [Carboxylicivirga caseinilyticus]|uniref:sensor histidine kinase n=1 Tax=Carboxylicivirga caseinilyticus TaxID=3417572 RepID=UPI003D34B30B|nr:histidine kinase [Marinilabiliaceae bacterium A049]